MGQVGGGFNGHFVQAGVSTVYSAQRQVSWALKLLLLQELPKAAIF
jgi:hypothetical protein